jgi:DNA-binding transcriptional ArsR family regulator
MTVIGSRVRAGLLSALFAGPAHTRAPVDLGRAAGLAPQHLYRELRRLEEVGLVRVTLVEGRRQYEPETDDPVARALARFVHQTRGSVPAMRAALQGLRARVLAWLTSTTGTAVPPGDRAVPRLVVLTSAPRRLVQRRLGPAAAPFPIQSMSIGEWVTRHEKREILVRRARRGAKLWIVGSGDELVRWEQEHRAARATLKAALADWREELSDDWDDDWDPSAPGGPITR